MLVGKNLNVSIQPFSSFRFLFALNPNLFTQPYEIGLNLENRQPVLVILMNLRVQVGNRQMYRCVYTIVYNSKKLYYYVNILQAIHVDASISRDKNVTTHRVGQNQINNKQ